MHSGRKKSALTVCSKQQTATGPGQKKAGWRSSQAGSLASFLSVFILDGGLSSTFCLVLLAVGKQINAKQDCQSQKSMLKTYIPFLCAASSQRGAVEGINNSQMARFHSGMENILKQRSGFEWMRTLCHQLIHCPSCFSRASFLIWHILARINEGTYCLSICPVCSRHAVLRPWRKHGLEQSAQLPLALIIQYLSSTSMLCHKHMCAVFSQDSGTIGMV